MKRFLKTKRNSFFLPSSDVTAAPALTLLPLSEGETFLGLPSNREPFLPCLSQSHACFCFFQGTQTEKKRFLALALQKRIILGMDLIRGGGKSSRMSLISKPSCQILSKALAMSKKSIPVASCLAKPL
ncbi:hypothetical protein TNCV_3846781 [Trichonephila clavipes]|nr:hypothetical protein TNCV_3846781 [Trichonephila clavipes]